MDLTPQQLAGKILDQIESKPLTFDMQAWVANQEDIVDWRTGDFTGECGTTRCVAGWAVHFVAEGPEDALTTRTRVRREAGLPSASWMIVGAHLLGLDARQAEYLFLEADERQAIAELKDIAGR